MINCWEHPENSSKRPQGYNPKLSLDHAKKQISKAIKSSNNQTTNSNSKTEVQGAMVEIQGAMIECKNEFSCSLINFDEIEKGEPPNDTVATSLSPMNVNKETPLKSWNARTKDTGETFQPTSSPITGTNHSTLNYRWMIKYLQTQTKWIYK